MIKSISSYILDFFRYKVQDKAITDEEFVLVDDPNSSEKQTLIKTLPNGYPDPDPDSDSEFDQKLLNRKVYNQKKKKR